jgi:ABC-2 type transport system ATP-binding protein
MVEGSVAEGGVLPAAASNAERSTSTAASPPEPRLELRDLVVDRAGRQVLSGLSLRVRRGEIFGLLGPNGAGKTTAFHVLTGLLAPRSGALLLDGRAMQPGDASFRARCGIVFQEPALDPRLSARRNLRLAARLYGVPRTAMRHRIETALEMVKLSDRADEPVSRLSGGMRRRVELARGLIHEPNILVLDEPTAGLDEAAFRRFWSTLLEMRRREDLTLLLTTHRADEAEFCDRIAILDRGGTVACDTPDRLREQVRGDLIVLETDEPEQVAAALAERFSVEARVLDGKVLLRREKSHELIPRVVEALPEGALHSISLRRTGLGEVFLELTGHELDDDLAQHTAPSASMQRGGEER